jgi:cell division transport system ATP-binding protein
MIRLEHVSKVYQGSQTALREIDLSIDSGAFVFLTGASGAGKSTLLRLLYREEELTTGRILVGGQDISRLNSRGVALLRRRIGLVFQEHRLLEKHSALDNVALAAEVCGETRRASRAKAEKILGDLGLTAQCRQPVERLSGGEQQRVAIGRALVNQPALILADEPTGNLDRAAAEATVKLLHETNRQGTTVVIATHDRSLLATSDARVVTLAAGQLADGAAPFGADGGSF